MTSFSEVNHFFSLSMFASHNLHTPFCFLHPKYPASIVKYLFISNLAQFHIMVVMFMFKDECQLFNIEENTSDLKMSRGKLVGKM